jgi:serine/threonine-protein kinase
VTSREGVVFMPYRTAARISTVIATALLAATAMSSAPAGREQTAPAPARPEIVRLPPNWQLSRGAMGPMFTEFALSPDGRTIAFNASPDGSMEKGMLHVQPSDRPDATAFPGTEGACMPAFSPDGEWIAFWSYPKILKVAAKGGPVVTVIEPDTIPYGLAWAPDGRIIFGTEDEGLRSASASRGSPEMKTLTTVDAATEASHRLPHMLPGGKALLMTSMVSPMGNATRLEWLSLETAKRKVLVEDAADGRYLPTGHLVFVRRGALMTVPFDLARLEVKGPAVTLVPRLMQALNAQMPVMNSGAGQYSVSESGSLIWASGSMYPDRPSQVYWVDRSGHAEPWTALGTRSVGALRLSPDGQRVAATGTGFDRGVFVLDLQGKTVTRSTPEGAQGWFFPPFWTPDGKRLVFGWWKTTHPKIWWTAADGAGRLESLAASKTDRRASGLTRDGRYLTFIEVGAETGGDILVMRMSDRQVTPFAATKASETFPEFSPNGRWLAYVSNETARNEVYLRSFPDGRRTLQVSTDGGMSPLWGPDGRELFYWNTGFTKLMRVEVSPGPNLSAGTPALLFEFSAYRSGFLRTFDIAPDGRRFLVQKALAPVPVPVTELKLVRQWFDDVKRLSQVAK